MTLSSFWFDFISFGRNFKFNLVDTWKGLGANVPRWELPCIQNRKHKNVVSAVLPVDGVERCCSLETSWPKVSTIWANLCIYMSEMRNRRDRHILSWSRYNARCLCARIEWVIRVQHASLQPVQSSASVHDTVLHAVEPSTLSLTTYIKSGPAQIFKIPQVNHGWGTRFPISTNAYAGDSSPISPVHCTFFLNIFQKILRDRLSVGSNIPL
jgi:hypothetical protein